MVEDDDHTRALRVLTEAGELTDGAPTAGKRLGTTPAAEAAITLDHVLGGRVALAQPAGGFRAAIDPVLLAASVDADPGERAIDLGCGVGTAALCLMARVPDLGVVGVDADPAMVGLARDNAQRNRRDGFSACAIDILADPAGLAEVGAARHVLTNPPFHAAAASDPSPDRAKAQATIADFPIGAWLSRASSLLEPRGCLSVIFRADRLDALITALPDSLGGVVIVPLWPHAGEPAKRVIVSGIKGSRAPLTLSAGLVLHKPDGAYTDEADAVLRDGAGLGDVVAGSWRPRVRRRPQNAGA
ncbi:MAG: methyltransferase [Alphaproteobacteria bacterium]|nr:methyltransferase [Alphaproteobacteria bacterium]